jgi:hypothetical protein
MDGLEGERGRNSQQTQCVRAVATSGAATPRRRAKSPRRRLRNKLHSEQFENAVGPASPDRCSNKVQGLFCPNRRATWQDLDRARLLYPAARDQEAAGVAAPRWK